MKPMEFTSLYDNVVLDQLKGSRILFIGVNFYHFNEEIIKKMQGYGAHVRFFYERQISLQHALIDNFFPQFIDQWQDRHYESILKTIESETYDYLLVVRGYRMKGKFVDRVRSLNPGIKTIMYQWDSLQNWNYLDKVPFFDKTYSFDFLDCLENKGIEYTPTFYTDEFADLPIVPLEHDFFFYGNYTPERYEKMLQLKEYLLKKGQTLKTHLYISWKRYILHRLKGYRIERKNISFRKMSKGEYVELFNKSRVIVDITTHTQSGMAMRVIDALGAGKPILTCNKHITLEPNYNPDQIQLLDLDNLHIPEGFLKGQVIFRKHDYSIERWLSVIFK